MEALLGMFATFSMDMFAEAKMPCMMTGFTYFTRIMMVAIAPIVMTVVYIGLGVAWASRKRERRRKHTVMVRRSVIVRERARGSHNLLMDGLWIAAPYILFTIDLFHPTITKTLCSFFTCRNLGAAGWWLEQEQVCPLLRCCMYMRLSWGLVHEY